MCAFVPQEINDWPGTRAVVFVHGIGDASTGLMSAFPIEEFRAALGPRASEFAIYHLNYDFINDWMAVKTSLAALVNHLRLAIAKRFGDDDLSNTIAEYAGDVLWPVLSGDIRLAIRDAFVAQLAQIHLDSGEAALARGDDPLDYDISIIAHSLGCFHTYETLSATAREAQYRLRPGTDLFRLRSVVLMASPVQFIRTIANDIRITVPDLATLFTLAQPLAVPAETVGGKTTTSARQFLSVTGTQDPVGGFLLGNKQSWAYMDLEGQKPILDSQTLVGVDKKAALKAALNGGKGAIGAVNVTDPHSWSRYMTRQAAVLEQALLA